MKNWNDIICALTLIRLGQELGTDSEIACAVHAMITIFLTTLGGCI